MKAKLRMAGIATAFVLVLIPDLAEAQVGGRRRRTRRRTAVVVHSATKAQDQQAAEQQAAADQQAAAPQEQQPAAGEPLPAGTVVSSLPAGCVTISVDDAEYHHCGVDWYRAAFQENTLVYVTTEPPQ